MRVSPRVTRSRQARTFLTITFGAVLLLCFPALIGVDADYLGVATPLAQWIPALAVILAVRPVRGSRALRGSWRASPFGGARTWIVIGLITAAILGVAAAQIVVGVAVGVVSWSPDPAIGETALLVLPVALLALLSATGEEFGWRGFLWTRVRGNRGFWWTALAVGAVWAVWHLPLLVAYGAQGDLSWRTVLGTTVDLLMASLVLGAGRELSGSVWPAAWGHALVNSVLVFATTAFVTPATQLPDSAFWVYKALGWAAWVGAAAGMLALRRRLLIAPARDVTGRSLDETEDALLEAMRTSDVDALRALLAEDLRFRPPDGSVVDRAADLHAHASGALRFLQIEETHRTTEQQKGRGSTVSRSRVHLVDRGRIAEATMTYRRSWAIVGGRWQVVAGSAEIVNDEEAVDP